MVLWLMLMFGSKDALPRCCYWHWLMHFPIVCSALRVYVLWNKDILLFMGVLALNLVPVAANLVCIPYWVGNRPLLTQYQYLYSQVMPKVTGVPFAACISFMPLPGHEQIRCVHWLLQYVDSCSYMPLPALQEYVYSIIADDFWSSFFLILIQ